MLRAIGLLLLLSVCPAKALDMLSGNQLHEWCASPHTPLRTVAMAYITGVIQHELRQPKPMVCLPSGVTGQQLRDTVCKWIAESPETRHLAAPDLVEASVFTVWACPTQ